MLKYTSLILFCLITGAQLHGWDLVKNGKSEAVIVLPADAWPMEAYAASELQYIIRKASGADLPIVRIGEVPSGKKQVLLGRAAKADLKDLPLSGFRIKTTPTTLLLAGRDTRGKVERLQTAAGTLYAVYQWAEDHLKVRWLWASELGEEIPPQSTVSSGSYDLRVKPKLQFASARKFDWRWNRRLLRADLSRYIRFAGCSSQGHAFIDWYRRYGKTHPDYFEQDSRGHRISDRYAGMCVSNPKFHQQIVDNWRNAKAPHLAVNAKENDAHGRCMCDTCRSWDGEDQRWPTVYYSGYRNVGERYARFYKAVWELASKINPDVQVGGYAYMNYVYAPRHTRLNKNIIIGFVDDLPFPRTAEYQRKVNEEIENWGKSGASLYLRPNFFLSSYAMPELYYHQYAEQFKLAWSNGMLGLDVDGPNNSWATIGPNLYVMSRLAVDPEQVVDHLMAEYCEAFGKAAPLVKQYFDYWEKYTMDNAAAFNRIHETESVRKWFLYGFHYATLAHRFFPVGVFAPAEKLLNEAARLCAGDTKAEQRVRFLLQGLKHARLCSETSALFADPASSNQERQKALIRVKAYRKTLMPAVADIPYFESPRRLEGVAWTLRDIDLSNAVSLPEKWQSISDPDMKGRESGYFQPDFQDDGWIPRSTWMFLEDQGVNDYRFAWYRTSVTIPADRRGWRVLLRLGAMDESGWCWVNGKQVGELLFNAALDPHSWENPQEYDITDTVRFGSGNQITVLVENLTGKGGLWKPSYIRFERAGTGEKIIPEFPVNRSYLSKRTENGSVIYKMIGRPDRGKANAWQTSVVTLPFKNVGKALFRLKAKIRTQHLGNGEFLVAVRQINASGQTITYNGISLKRNCQWKDFSKEISIRENAVKIALFLIGIHLPENAAAEIRDISIERLKN